jgi:hypothetical protein
MANLLLIVSKDEPESFAFLKKAFGSRKDIDIIVDRRAGQAAVVVGRDRRARRNDEQLRTYGWVLVRRPPAAPRPDGAARAAAARATRPTKRALSRRRRPAKRRGSARPRPRQN